MDKLDEVNRKIKEIREDRAELCHTGTFIAQAYSTVVVLVFSCFCFEQLGALVREACYDHNINQEPNAGGDS